MQLNIPREIFDLGNGYLIHSLCFLGSHWCQNTIKIFKTIYMYYVYTWFDHYSLPM